VELDTDEAAMLRGDRGESVAIAMRIMVAAAKMESAQRFVAISAAHIDGCLYHGPSSMDFVRALSGPGAHVAVPTTLNVGGLDLMSPELFIGSAQQSADARALMDAYLRLGCAPTFTCAPYQLPGRPRRGDDVAWAESNAIVFGNSVIGLRTNRYGDLIDICAALTGRVPLAGFHLEENRRGGAHFTVHADVLAKVDADLLPSLLGHHIGRRCGTDVPVLSGVGDVAVDEDWLKHFGAAAASSGGVAMFHVVGVTPEAPDLEAAFQGHAVVPPSLITLSDVEQATRELTTASATSRLGGVSVGTPHLSRTQLRKLAMLLDGRTVSVPTYATTSRTVLAAEPDAEAVLREAGVAIVRDTCTYGQSAIMSPDGTVLTNSAKWAYYAPANLGFSVALASIEDCVESAVAGEIRIRRTYG
jgi:predicted aconitase